MENKFLEHTEPVDFPFVPFLNLRRPTALYWMDRDRYGKYFQPTLDRGGKPLHERWFKVKVELQKMYQHELEDQGAVLKEIFLQREAREDTKAVDYLLWIGYQWDLYQIYLNDGGEDEGFLRFVQSDLSRNEELFNDRT